MYPASSLDIVRFPDRIGNAHCPTDLRRLALHPLEAVRLSRVRIRRVSSSCRKNRSGPVATAGSWSGEKLRSVCFARFTTLAFLSRWRRAYVFSLDLSLLSTLFAEVFHESESHKRCRLLRASTVVVWLFQAQIGVPTFAERPRNGLQSQELSALKHATWFGKNAFQSSSSRKLLYTEETFSNSYENELAGSDHQL